MLIRRSVVASVCALAAFAPSLALADDAPVDPCAGSVSKICVTAEDPGSSGSGPSKSAGTPASSTNSKSTEPVCEATVMDPQPPAGDPKWEGHQPGDGAVYVRGCLSGTPAGTPAISIFWAATPPAANAIDPAILAQRAVDSMNLVGPDVQSPRAGGKYTVGVPLWLWVGKGPTTYGPNTASATAGAVTVQATATVTSIKWDMGDGAAVTCNGPGTPYRDSQGMSASPDCGHQYQATSKGQPGDQFTCRATSTWTINWQVTGGGQTGQLTAVRQSVFTVSVGEMHVLN